MRVRLLIVTLVGLMLLARLLTELQQASSRR